MAGAGSGVAPDALGRACTAFGVASPVPVATTRTSHVYKVIRADGTSAALKLLTEAGREEMAGARFMEWRDGHGTARIFGLSGEAILMEWLEGPTLGELVRGGDPLTGIAVMEGLLPRLHAPGSTPCPSLPRLEDRFAALFDLDLAPLDPGLRSALAEAREVARDCLAQSGPPVPLHGDLHHDNILGSGGSWRAIDAKGVVGCRGYEVANAFGNPVGLPQVTRDPRYHDALAARCARVLDLPERRIREWAVAHMGLALAWHREDGGSGASEWEHTLPVLLAGLRGQRQEGQASAIRPS